MTRRKPEAPVLFGRPMRRKTNWYGFSVWRQRFGPLVVEASHDDDDERVSEHPWYWQIDVWTKRSALSGRTCTLGQTLRQIEHHLRKLQRELTRAMDT